MAAAQTHNRSAQLGHYCCALPVAGVVCRVIFRATAGCCNVCSRSCSSKQAGLRAACWHFQGAALFCRPAGACVVFAWPCLSCRCVLAGSKLIHISMFCQGFVCDRPRRSVASHSCSGAVGVVAVPPVCTAEEACRCCWAHLHPSILQGALALVLGLAVQDSVKRRC